MKNWKIWLSIGLVVCLSILTNGCNKGAASAVNSSDGVNLPPSPTKTFSSEDIQTAMFKLGINTGNFVISDGNYVLAKREWLETEFSSGLSAFQFQFGINNWNEESNDCDKFAGAASFYLKWLNHSSRNRNVKAALAAGEVYYRRDRDGQNHAINLFILETGGQLTPSFYEPQTRRFVRLSQSEVFSVYFWKL